MCLKVVERKVKLGKGGSFLANYRCQCPNMKGMPYMLLLHLRCGTVVKKSFDS